MLSRESFSASFKCICSTGHCLEMWNHPVIYVACRGQDRSWDKLSQQPFSATNWNAGSQLLKRNTDENVSWVWHLGEWWWTSFFVVATMAHCQPPKMSPAPKQKKQSCQITCKSISIHEDEAKDTARINQKVPSMAHLSNQGTIVPCQRTPCGLLVSRGNHQQHSGQQDDGRK